jgi:Na+(H+)/acetate symporter ActP
VASRERFELNGVQMSAQVVLIIAGLIFIAAAIVGGGNFVKVILPNLPVWARVISAGIGVTAFILGLEPA